MTQDRREKEIIRMKGTLMLKGPGDVTSNTPNDVRKIEETPQEPETLRTSRQGKDDNTTNRLEQPVFPCIHEKKETQICAILASDQQYEKAWKGKRKTLGLGSSKMTHCIAAIDHLRGEWGLSYCCIKINIFIFMDAWTSSLEPPSAQTNSAHMLENI